MKKRLGQLMSVEEMVEENLETYENNFEPWYTPYQRVIVAVGVTIGFLALLYLEAYVDNL